MRFRVQGPLRPALTGPVGASALSVGGLAASAHAGSEAISSCLTRATRTAPKGGGPVGIDDALNGRVESVLAFNFYFLQLPEIISQ